MTPTFPRSGASGHPGAIQAELYIFDGLSSDQLLATINLVADRADHYDSLLQKRFGGKTTFEDDEGDEFDV